MVVYADVLLAVNLLTNFALLSATAELSGRSSALWRRLLAALLGAAYALISALPRLAGLTSLPGKAAAAFAMLLLCFGWGRQLLRCGLWFVLLSAAFAGVLLVLGGVLRLPVYLVGGTAVYPFSFRMLILTAGCSYALLMLLLRRFGAHSAALDLRPVTVCFRGRKQRFTALMDSGNCLRDPLSGGAVFVLDGTLAEGLLPELKGLPLHEPVQTFEMVSSSIPGAQLIPYHAIGTQSGLLLAAKSDWVLLGSKKRNHAIVAFSPSPVSNGSYEVIAGGE